CPISFVAFSYRTLSGWSPAFAGPAKSALRGRRNPQAERRIAQRTTTKASFSAYVFLDVSMACFRARSLAQNPGSLLSSILQGRSRRGPSSRLLKKQWTSHSEKLKAVPNEVKEESLYLLRSTNAGILRYAQN